MAEAGGSLTVTSAFRPQAYQDHFIEVWDKWNLLKDSSESECAEIKAAVIVEFNLHGLQETQPPARSSFHTAGTAFDAIWTPEELNIDELAGQCNLFRSVPISDPVHFRLN